MYDLKFLNVGRAEHGNGIFCAQQVDVGRLIGSVQLTVAIDRYPVTLIHDGHLDQRTIRCRLNETVFLRPLSAFEMVTAGHPLAGLQLTEHDPVELIRGELRSEQALDAPIGMLRCRTPDGLRIETCGRPDPTPTMRPEGSTVRSEKLMDSPSAFTTAGFFRSRPSRS